MSKTTVPVCERDANDYFCNTLTAIEIASKIAGYTVAPSTLQDAAKRKAIDSCMVSHKLWFVKPSLCRYAEGLRDKNAKETKECANAFVKEFYSLPKETQMAVKMIIQKCKKEAK